MGLSETDRDRIAERVSNALDAYQRRDPRFGAALELTEIVRWTGFVATSATWPLMNSPTRSNYSSASRPTPMRGAA